MSNKNVFVPVDPEGFGCGLLLGLIIRYWRELLIAVGFIFACIVGATIVQSISGFVSTAKDAQAATQQSISRVIQENQQADDLVANQEYYLAASLVRTILSEDPNNDHAMALMKSIAGHVSGGLAVGSGVYYPFSSAESITFVSGLHGALVRVSPDGQRGLIVNGENQDIYSIVNLSDGSFMKIDKGIPSTDLTRVELYESPTKIKNISDGEIQEIDCSNYTSHDTWSQDSRFIISGDLIVDTESSSCRNINVPGLSGTVVVDGEKMWIVLPGNYQDVVKGQLFEANIDGSSLRKLADLPFTGRDDGSRTFLAPDSSAIYLSEGLLVSTRTGQIVSAVPNAIGWLETNPIIANIKQPQLTIQPESGPRGTLFSFSLEGGEPGLEVAMSIEPTSGGGMPIYFFDDNGKIEDDPNAPSDAFSTTFGMPTDINTASGIYTVKIYASPNPNQPDLNPMSVATFTVTGP